MNRVRGVAPTHAPLPPAPNRAVRKSLEFSILSAVARSIPPVPGAGRLCNGLARFYLRKPRPPHKVRFSGSDFIVDAGESMTQRELAFMPHLHERTELRFLRQVLTSGATFADVGAHVGTYAIVAARIVGPTGRVCALEAFAPTFEKLQANIALNNAVNVAAKCIGVSDRSETLYMQHNPANSAGNRLATGGGPPVACRALLDILGELGFSALTALKVDVEGLERRVVSKYFATAPTEWWPEYVFVETNQAKDIDGSAVPALLGCGYYVIGRSPLCYIMRRLK